MRWTVCLLVAACTSQPTTRRCERDADCHAGEQCGGGVCIPGPIVCSATQPCSPGDYCCGGLCSPTACCLADIECANGYCQDGTC